MNLTPFANTCTCPGTLFFSSGKNTMCVMQSSTVTVMTIKISSDLLAASTSDGYLGSLIFRPHVCGFRIPPSKYFSPCPPVNVISRRKHVKGITCHLLLSEDHQFMRYRNSVQRVTLEGSSSAGVWGDGEEHLRFLTEEEAGLHGVRMDFCLEYDLQPPPIYVI